MAEGVVRGPGDGDKIENPIVREVMIKLRGEPTGGTMTAMENVAGPGEGPPMHTHANEDESIYVLEGELRFKLGDKLSAGPAGTLAFIPRGMPHAWQCVGDGPARLLIHFTPAGMERFFDEFAIEEPNVEGFRRAGEKAGMEVVGPPLAQSDPL